MNRINAFFAVIFCAVLFFSATVSAQNVQNFKIENFDANYYLDKDSENASTLKVEETIVADFPNINQNHGILRAIPARYQDHTVSLKVASVIDESGKTYKYTTYEQNDNLILKIGDPDRYVQGRVVYKINYDLKDVVSFYDDHDEFYWDINGDQWMQDFGSVTTTIHIPKNLGSALQERQLCYAGYFASTQQNCSITKVDSGNEFVVSAKADDVRARQTLSVVLGFNKGTFDLSSTVKNEKTKQKTEIIAGIVLGLIPPIFAFIFMVRRWRQFGNDPKGRGVIVPEYEPPKGFNPLTSDFMLKQALRSNAISATVIDMAVKGYITIIEIPKKVIFGKKDYQLKLDRALDESAPEVVTKALKIIFDSELAEGSSVKISDFRKSTSKQQAVYKSMKSLEDSLAADLTVSGYFKKNPKKVRDGYMLWGIFLIFSAFALAWIVSAVGFMPLFGLVFGVGIAGAVVFLFAFIMPARTESGVAAHDALLGLKDYIKLAEADRLKFLQSPEGAEKIAEKGAFDPKTPEAKIKLFEKLLPYAMLFGLEKGWAKQFNDIYTNPPSWYQGGNWSAFNAGYLVGSLSDFNTATGTSFAAPSSSSGSGFSGGGAGGGGGGGGGGGW
jgi:uncharacterized membrane protein